MGCRPPHVGQGQMVKSFWVKAKRGREHSSRVRTGLGPGRDQHVARSAPDPAGQLAGDTVDLVGQLEGDTVDLVGPCVLLSYAIDPPTGETGCSFFFCLLSFDRESTFMHRLKIRLVHPLKNDFCFQKKGVN
jgi:hypothetical protein